MRFLRWLNNLIESICPAADEYDPRDGIQVSAWHDPEGDAHRRLAELEARMRANEAAIVISRGFEHRLFQQDADANVRLTDLERRSELRTSVGTYAERN